MYNKGPFADWVPKPLMLLLVLIFLFPIMGVSGVYSNNMTDITGFLGGYTEHVSFANNALTIGMSVAMLIIMRVKMRFRTKEIVAGGLSIIAILVLMCGTTHNYFVFIACNFLIGFIKMFVMLEVIIIVMFILAPDGDRRKFYGIFYPIAIGSSTIMFKFLSQLIFDQGIESAYLLVATIMLVLVALSLIFQHNQRFSFKLPLYQVDWISLILFATSSMCLNYVLVFAKQQNWFHSTSIQWCTFLSIFLFVLLIFRQKGQKRKLIHFEAFLLKNVRHSIVLLVFLGIYLSSASVYMQWNMAALGYNNLINAELGMWGIPPLILGGALAIIGFNKGWNLKYFIWLGFAAFFVHSLLIYFIIQPNMNQEMFYLILMVRNFGMVVLFISVWFYATGTLPQTVSMGVTAILLSFRTFMATAFGGLVLGYLSTQFQLQSLSDMSNYWDTTMMGSAAMRGYGSMQIGSLLAAGKTLMGWLCLLFIPLSIYILTHDYGHKNQRKKVYYRKLFRGNSTKGYRFN